MPITIVTNVNNFYLTYTYVTNIYVYREENVSIRFAEVRSAEAGDLLSIGKWVELRVVVMSSGTNQSAIRMKHVVRCRMIDMSIG